MKLTINHIKQTLYIGALGEEFAKFVLDTANKAIEIALAEQHQAEAEKDLANAEAELNDYITAEEARELGAGKAEYQYQGSKWDLCGYQHIYSDFVKYRAIRPQAQPEPLDLSNIKGVGRNFEIKPVPVEPTCQIKNLDSGVTETMTREAAKLLQAELGDTVEWHIELQTPRPKTVSWYPVEFYQKGIYTYKRKANLVKLDGVWMTREAAIALWESKKDTYEFLVKGAGDSDFEVMTHHHHFNEYAASGCEYQLRAKPLKQVSWPSVPVGAMVNCFQLEGVFKLQWVKDTACQITQDGQAFYPAVSSLILAPASDQTWLNWRGGECPVPEGCMFEVTFRNSYKHKNSDIEDPYSDDSWAHVGLSHDIIEYRITGLAEGYELK